MEQRGDNVAEIKARLNVEDVVGQYVQLKRSGRNFKGLSPFTNEKTASFMVSPEKQIWHDFSSGRGGDIFSFVMEMEGLDFRGALELLARQAGVDLEQSKSQSAGSKLKPRLAQANESAADFYAASLKASQPALKYLVNKRGFGKKTILGWRLGYSPDGGRSLTDHLVKAGFSLTEIRRAGLAVERRGQTVDMFRGRIMVPLCDGPGGVVGFTARQLVDEPNSPKYINTPSTPLYDKSRLVFGLHMAKEAIRKLGFVVVAEGQLDVISSHQAGVGNVVATSGTAMTEMHLNVLKRFTADIRLSFDADRAGIAAAERIIPISQKTGVSLKIINLPEGDDPDTLARRDVKLWQKAIDKAEYAVDWLVERYQSELDLTTALGKKAFSDALIPTIRRLNDPVEQEHYVNLVAKLTGSSAEAVKAKLTGSADESGPRLKRSKYQPSDLAAEGEYKKLQDSLLAIAWGEPAARELLKDFPKELFSGDQPRLVLVAIQKSSSDKLPLVKNAEDYVKILELQFEELYQGMDSVDRLHQAALARRRLVDVYVKLKKRQLAAKMQGATGSELTDLIKKANSLNQLIKLTRG